MERLKRFAVMVLAAAVMMVSLPQTGLMTAFAEEARIYTDKISSGKTGKNMNVSFTVKNTAGRDIKELGISFDVSGGEIWDESEEDRMYGYAFPFEITGSINDTENPKSVGKLERGKEKNVSLSGRVRRDLSEGYYTVPVVAWEKTGDGWNWLGNADLKVWISKSTGTDDEEDTENKTYDFVLGEGQSTPDGTYPNVMNFSLNLRNNSPGTVYNVKAAMTLDSDTEKFPFEINDANYDRMFERIEKGETVALDYSFAIRKDAYSGYYPIGMKIYYSTSSTGEELKTYETSFFVRVHNKDKEDEMGDFNEHDRTKARIVIDGFSTNPDTIIAGETFDLLLRIKNASDSIEATNILFSIESEKVSESAVFSTESGSSSVAMNRLGPGEVTEIPFRLISRPGVDQRSYTLTVKARFDSPEFKNADETMSVDIPIKQIARLNTSTFEVMPSAISVGEEANIMFGINNTGKVLLYNVTAKFEADSIQTNEAYVGNIKPGETGNVDCMITGLAPTADDGKIKVTISYEDENGEVFSEKKELNLYVSEPVPDDFEAGNFDDVPMEEPSFFDQHKMVIIPVCIAAGVVVLTAAVVLVKRHKRKKREAELNEDMDDEIS